MSEAEERIRVKGEAFLRRRYPGARIIHELKINNGVTRIDLAAVTHNRIALAEVKSERDVLDRLDRQISDARRITGAVYALVAEQHRAKLDARWGQAGSYDRDLTAALFNCALMYETEDGFKLDNGTDTVRESLEHLTDPRALLELLWADELKTLLLRHSLSFGRRATMQHTMRVALENLNGRQIREGVCEALMGRPFARADQQAIEVAA
jgi:hypothetical protein